VGIYFRKSKTFGLLRLNFSKKGVGFSLGVPGMRIGKQAGRKGVYTRGGKNGVYFRKKLD
jgi:hypothetical protein